MPTYRQDVQADVERIVRTVKPSFLDDPDFDKAISDALIEHSSTRPDVLVVEVESDGAERQDLPAEYERRQTIVEKIEFPIQQNPPQFLSKDEWSIAPEPTKDVLILLRKVEAAAKYWIHMTRLHVLTTADSSLSTIERGALSHLAAGYCFEQLAAHYGRSTDSTIAGDVTPWNDKMPNFDNHARTSRAAYKRMLKGNEESKESSGSGFVVDSSLRIEGRIDGGRYDRYDVGSDR